MGILVTNPNIRFILTLDYELYGNGSGNVFDSVIKPTKKILNICRQYNAKLTIFMEIIEYWKIRQEWQNGNQMGYSQDPALSMENQIREAVSEGHDVQLHLHPQWLNAVYAPAGWRVDFDIWRLGHLASVENWDLAAVLKKGKQDLERILRPVNPNYECSVLRAGGFNIQPSKKVIKAMKTAGFIADSSVFAGGYEDGALSKYDFREVDHDKRYWYSSHDDIIVEDSQKSGVLEIPLFSLTMRRWQKLEFARIYSALRNRRSGAGRIASRTSRIKKSRRPRYFLEKESITWDFCLFSARKNRRFLKKALELSARKEGFCPFVLIGHPKNFLSPRGFKFLLKLAKKNHLSFLTMNDVMRIILNRKSFSN